MAIRKAVVDRAQNQLGSELLKLPIGVAVTERAITKRINEAKAKPYVGDAGAAAMRMAYDQAVAKAGGQAPDRLAIRAEINKVAASLRNERALGRVNDGWVDARELKNLHSPLADALYRYANTSSVFEDNNSAKMKPSIAASLVKIRQAARSLSPVIDAAAAAMKANPRQHDSFALYLREAAMAAGLKGPARAALMTACNAATPRGDSGEGPTPAKIKAVLTNAVGKLKAADGATIVDLKRPFIAPKSSKDGIVTGLEVDRRPSVVGKTPIALLTYAATL